MEINKRDFVEGLLDDDYKLDDKGNIVLTKEIMLKQDAVSIILEYYNEIKEETKSPFCKTEYGKGHLCAIRYILIEVYGFKTNDNRF